MFTDKELEQYKSEMDAAIRKGKTGKILDAAVAERVLNHPVIWSGPGDRAIEGYPQMYGGGDQWPIPGFSQDNFEALPLLDKWDGDYEIRRQNDQYRCTLFVPSMQWEAWGETISQAICLAMLKAAADKDGKAAIL